MKRALAILPILAACSDYAVTRSTARDGWIQTDRGAELDILWVIDDSASMAEEQETLTERSSAFATPLAAAELPFRLAITTTSGTGELLAEPIGDQTEDIEGEFAAILTRAGLEGAREEAGFASAILAADHRSNDYARSDADLELVVYSDEDDHSGIDASDFVSELESTREGRSVVVSVVVGDLPTGCASAAGAADPGEAYVEAQEATGGARESICTADTEGMLERLANQVLGLQTKFVLSALPLLATMDVRVDGVAIPRRDSDGWRYDGSDNSIIFDGWAIPRPGAAIDAFYYDYTGNRGEDTAAL
ncbi:MAG: hypothetical protein FJ090_17650 [Deltaproteobacteria bacterium]|nr:hypothetical protein [Deltaproteobacteria bacterium]